MKKLWGFYIKNKMSEKKRLLFVGYDVQDPTSWSGTPYAIYSNFIQQGVDVVTYNPYNWKHKPIAKVLVKILQHTFCPGLGNDLSVWDQMILRFLIKRKLRKEGINKVFYTANGTSIRSRNIKSYLYSDAVSHERYGYYPYARKRGKFRKYINKHMLVNSEDRQFSSMDYIFTQSDWVEEFLVDKLRISKDKVEKVGFGLNIKLLSEDKNYEEPLMLIVLRRGNEKLKGLCLLLDAFKIVKSNIPNVKLAVVGTDGEEQEGVTYYYDKPRSVTVELFKKASLYVMPALNEPNGQTYLEGLANKAAIVGLNRFAFPEFCGYGKYGYICKNDDANELADILISALRNMQEVKSKADAGYHYVANLNYNWNDIVKRFVQVIFNES